MLIVDLILTDFKIYVCYVTYRCHKGYAKIVTNLSGSVTKVLYADAVCKIVFFAVFAVFHY